MATAENTLGAEKARVHFENFLFAAKKCSDHQHFTPTDNIEGCIELLNLVAGEGKKPSDFDLIDLRLADLTIQQQGAYTFAHLLLYGVKSEFSSVLERIGPGSRTMSTFFESLGHTIIEMSTPGANTTDRIHTTLCYYVNLFGTYRTRHLLG